MMSFAISAGEGTLLTFGTSDIDGFGRALGEVEFYVEDELGLNAEDVITTIVGPADGTGE